MMKPLCFVIMPFGKKKYKPRNAGDDGWVDIDFNQVYEQVIAPAIREADMEPIRADEEKTRGIIHKPMFERIILSDYVVADLTGANANVFYELGIRHAVKPYTTISIFSADCDLPFDLGPVRTAPYRYTPAIGVEDATSIKNAIREGLVEAKKTKTTDSPIYQLVDGIQFQNSVAHEKTDIFREKVSYNQELKEQLARARELTGSKAEKLKAVDTIAESLVLENEEAGVLIDVMLSYRALGDFERMVAFINRMPAHINQTVMVQEQLGFALNRLKKREEAVRVLEKVINLNGPSSETYGILGRVYKDYFDEALQKGNDLLVQSYLKKAADTYLKGFEADWRDAYPGINAVTLLDLQGEKEKVAKLAPVVEFAVERKMARKQPDYWDYATLIELAVLENDEDKATRALVNALACPIEKSWMFDTTINNLNLIRKYRLKRGEDDTLAQKIAEALLSQKE